MPSLTVKMKTLFILAKSLEKQKLNFYGSALFHMKTRDGPKCFANDYFCKHFFDSNSPQGSFKLNFLDNLGNSKVITQL